MFLFDIQNKSAEMHLISFSLRYHVIPSTHYGTHLAHHRVSTTASWWQNWPNKPMSSLQLLVVVTMTILKNHFVLLHPNNFQRLRRGRERFRKYLKRMFYGSQQNCTNLLYSLIHREIQSIFNFDFKYITFFK